MLTENDNTKLFFYLKNIKYFIEFIFSFKFYCIVINIAT